MTLRWIALDALEAHPENANRMDGERLEKLKGHIARTGLYEPIVVRPIKNSECGIRKERQKGENDENGKRAARYQILNGHHRARVLRELGHKRARCDVWTVGDGEARVLLATLNRLEGRDDPKARALLVSALAEGRTAEDLAHLLPEPAEAVERLLRLAAPPPAPASPETLEMLPQAMTFFLSEEQEAVVLEALKEVRNAECGMRNERQNGTRRAPKGSNCRTGTSAAAKHGVSRAERLERLAQWYLESIGRR